jgi:predicted membrane-bound spermidine synthase
MRRANLYVAVWLVGFGVMGFEMVASRMMVPGFGGGIDTWAALIATVLTGLTVGYFAGGALPLKWKTGRRVGALIVAAAFYLALTPVINVRVVHALADSGGATALLVAALVLTFVPVTLLGMFAPCSVDLLARMEERESAGTVAGRLYGVSTLGSVAGTLGTAFVLMPRLGSENIALLLAGMCFAAGALVWGTERY